MPKLARSEWYDLTRDMNWTLSYVSEEEAWPTELSNGFGLPAEAWWTWDEPYKITYPEYMHNQHDKDTEVYAVNAAIARSKVFEQLDPGWKSAIIAHYGAIAVPEYLASIGESRMGRFGRAAAWRNMALYGTLDEMRHGQIQLYIPYGLLGREPRFDWALKTVHTNEWGAIAARSLFDDMFTANDAVSTAVQLTFTFETGFTNLQFLGMAADAMNVGDVSFGALISSIQTDEARHAQQGEPTIKLLVKHGRKDVAQQLVDHMFWRSWRIFALLTGLSMDYYTPVEQRGHSFKEFMQEWICKQFLDQFRDFGLEKPWYWDDIFIPELDWYHHALHLGVWYWRPTVWWNPDGGVTPGKGRDWLEAKYPGWNDNFGRHWDVITENIRAGNPEATLPETLPMVCNMCHIPVVAPAGYNAGKLSSPLPRILDREGRRYTFCSEPCQWVFEQSPARFQGHLNIVDRFLTGQIQPPTMEGTLAYMGLSPAEMGQDAVNYAWAFAGLPHRGSSVA
ncbi:aromatic/alkene/methane monooxygenase hydroxylase/oxygenase subunit alpha [Mycobacterium sp. SM1]|uniref:aromatic/alkene/methane monooxygenase hydroxylase/oxygenase subunit alpha n=1 Tax=Mycobacterium sp. SM1 TaxID=2816243 RepID=UPI001BCF0E19|nr:aromatic/alkene/methane monooxygenase hydroxylase/oxygenase subunit alpha [Mycobacterium sp. SM1]MBS4730366.1 aromatic/alkene/methane monooxygenase hydroxylase/oxygenase subunit alpha [Mycobacterium sp. SM1]